MISNYLLWLNITLPGRSPLAVSGTLNNGFSSIINLPGGISLFATIPSPLPFILIMVYKLCSASLMLTEIVDDETLSRIVSNGRRVII